MNPIKLLNIVIPIGPKETEQSLQSLTEYLKKFRDAEIIYEREGTLWEARRRGIEKADRHRLLILCLDVDNRVTLKYIKDASKIILTGKADAVAADYAPPHSLGHVAFGASLWRTEKLKQIYDWKIRPDKMIVKIGDGEFANISSSFCECRYMWLRLRESGGRLYIPENYRVVHLKEKQNVDS